MSNLSFVTGIVLRCSLFIGLVSGCGGGGGGDNPTLEEALDEINKLKDEIVTEAGQNAVALKSLQTSELGDIFLLDTETQSVHSRMRNVSSVVEFTPVEKPVSSLSYSFEWKRDFQETIDTGLSYFDLVLKAAFKSEEIQSLSIKLSLTDPVIEEISSPDEVVQGYEQSVEDGTIRGNVLVTGLIKGKIRVEYRAFDKNSKEIRLSAEDLSGIINNFPSVSAGYSSAVSTSSNVEVVQESDEAQTVFAITYLKFSSDKLDDDYNTEQLGSSSTTQPTPSDVEEYYLSVDYYDLYSGYIVAVFDFTQTRKTVGSEEKVEWLLKIRNVDPLARTLTFNYNIDVYSSFNIFVPEFRKTGSINNLAYGETLDVGKISDNSLYLTYSTIYIY